MRMSAQSTMAGHCALFAPVSTNSTMFTLFDVPLIALAHWLLATNASKQMCFSTFMCIVVIVRMNRMIQTVCLMLQSTSTILLQNAAGFFLNNLILVASR